MGFSARRSRGNPIVSLSEAKTYLEYTPNDKDWLISSLVEAAARAMENECGQLLGSNTCVATWDKFPPYDQAADNGQAWEYGGGPSWGGYPSPKAHAIRLPYWPASGVATVKYYDAAGVQQMLAAGTDYLTHLDYMPSLVYPYPGKFWPVTQYGRLGAVEVAFTAGYQTSQQNGGCDPRPLRQAILMTADYWFKSRAGDEDASDPTRLGLPAGVHRLLGPYTRDRV